MALPRPQLDLSQAHNRLATFENWPHNFDTSALEDIAEAGHFYTGKADLTECYSCELQLKVWKKGVDPWKLHALFSPNCRFLNRWRDRQFIHEAFESYARNPDMKNPASRLATFESRSWLRLNKNIPAMNLVSAGFYHAGTRQKRDLCICFYCDLGIYSWSGRFYPWEIHAYHSIDCQHLIRLKGRELVKNARKKVRGDCDEHQQTQPRRKKKSSKKIRSEGRRRRKRRRRFNR